MPPVIVEKMFGAVLGTFFRSKIEDTAFNKLENVPDTLKVTSSDFENDGTLPWKYGGEGVGDDISPPLEVANVPKEAKSLVLICQDVDVPLPSPIAHQVVYGISPADTNWRAGKFDKQEECEEVATLGVGFGGRKEYTGPRPIVNDGPHRYVWQVFALGELPSPLAPRLACDAVFEELKKHAVAKGQIIGKYERTDEKY